jgi:hypothetical protein
MIEAGYDEMTHINQFMIGWVIKPGEDTRTLFRLHVLKRFPDIDLNSAPVKHTIQMMVDRGIAIDPTVGIHEQLALNRDGKTPPGMVDYLDHMPIGVRRDAMKALIDTSAPGVTPPIAPHSTRSSTPCACCTNEGYSSSSAPTPAGRSPTTANWNSISASA